MKYEYYVVPLEYNPASPAVQLEEGLSPLGKIGWELVSVLPPNLIGADGKRQILLCFLKRPLKK
jgi:hypothetical protein